MSIPLGTFVSDLAKSKVARSVIWKAICATWVYMCVQYKSPGGVFDQMNPLSIYRRRKLRNYQRIERELCSDTVFFDYRFRSAFPGCREIAEFSGDQAMQRLDILLRKPISCNHLKPLAYMRGGDFLHIDFYRRVTKNLILLDHQYFNVRRIVAIPSNSYYRHLLYVETSAMPATGLEPNADTYEEYGEYGRFRKRLVSREQHDDGATVVNGKVKSIKSRLRIRHLKDYNFIIAGHSSPINAREAEETIENILDGILSGNNTVQDLADYLETLKKNHLDR